MVKGVLIFLALLLGGCAGASTETITKTLDAAGNVVGVVSTKTAEASVKKEEIVHETLRARDSAIKETYAQSGMTMDWKPMQETVFYPGMTAPITVTRYMPVVTFREQPHFDQALPTAPSVHPVWHAVETLADKGLIGFGMYEAKELFLGGVGAQGDRYYGDYNPQTAEPYIVKPEIVTPEIVRP